MSNCLFLCFKFKSMKGILTKHLPVSTNPCLAERPCKKNHFTWTLGETFVFDLCKEKMYLYLIKGFYKYFLPIFYTANELFWSLAYPCSVHPDLLIYLDHTLFWHFWLRPCVYPDIRQHFFVQKSNVAFLFIRVVISTKGHIICVARTRHAAKEG